MNYTENYHLNQWDPTDRVLREDFNEDNWKIEEALKTAGQFEKLGELELQQPSDAVHLDVSSIDFGAWQRVHIDVAPKLSGNTGEYIWIYLNNLKHSYTRQILGVSGASEGCLASPSVFGDSPRYRFRITFYPMKQKDLYVHAFTIGTSEFCHGWNTSLTFEALQSVDFEASAPLQSGTSLTIWGEP